MNDSTEWDTWGVTAVRKRPLAVSDADDGVESEWYASGEEIFDTAPVLLAPRGIKQRTLIVSMVISALITATTVCVLFRSGGSATAAPAVAAPPPATAPPKAPVITPIPPAPAPAPVAAHRAAPKPTRVAKSAKRRKVTPSSGWASGFAQ